MIWLLSVCIAVAAFSALATGALVVVLRRRAILDHPNERSNHAIPKPRGGGLALLAVFAADAPPIWLGATLAAAAVGFLVWNWPPSRIFLGDVGSVPIGFLLGFLLLALAARGYGAAALILPAYYLADATLTILRRLLRGEKIWRPHSQHFYQQAVRGGLSHAQVSLAVLAANLVLIALAVLSLTAPLPALIGAAVVVAGLLAWMRA